MSKLKSIKELEMERATQPNFGKGISVASGFDLGAKSPLDSRLTVKTIEERNAHVTNNRAYEGMLVYVEADKKTYQLIDNAWQEFGFNEEKFQAGIQPLVEKNTEQDNRLKSLEDLVVGGEGEGLEAVIADIAANKAAIAAETQRATTAESALSDRLDIIEGTEDVVGSIAKALKDAKGYTDVQAEVKSTEALASAKTYTNEEIAKIDAAYKAADVQVLTDAKSYTDTKVNEAKTALESSIGTVDSKVTALEGRVATNESAISDLRDVISNKNSNTIVVNTEAEISTANPTPKVGDLAFVITSKRAYIFKGIDAKTAKNAPEGWVVFDEITNELDLVNYLKKSEAETTYRKLADAIAEGDLATELAAKINSKLDGSQVDAKVSAAVTPVSAKADANEAAIAQEVSDRQGEITRVEGLVTSAKSELNTSIESVDGKVNGLSTSLTEKETALKAEDTKLNNRISKFAPVVALEEPVDTEAGHVWLQLI